MNEAYILERSDMIALDFLMSDYESYLRKDGREDFIKTVQSFMKYIQKKEEKGNSLKEFTHNQLWKTEEFR